MKETLLASLLVSAVIGAQAGVSEYSVSLNGANEAPANASLGTGLGRVLYDDIAHTLKLEVAFSGLTGNVTASHIHAATASPFTGTAGVATTTPTFAGFPLGATFGVYTNTLDLTLAGSFNSAYVTANGGTLGTAEVALKTAMDTGRAYLNIHSTFAPGGEIRGFLTSVPEPTTAGLFALGALALARQVRRKI